jgi:GTPase SAR1 family protein
MAPKKSSARAPERKVLITAAKGQTGRLILELLLTGDDYAGKTTLLSALVFSEEAKQSLAEFDSVEAHVFDP